MDSAAALAAAVRSGQTTAVDVTRAALERAEAIASLNAFTQLDPDRAVRRAGEVDAAIAEGFEPGPLAGVPIVLKDLIDEEGIVTTAGSSFLDEPAAADSTVVRRLLDAGAVIVGRTGLHEFAYGFSSENDWWGPVRNPWDPDTSPGGSSGGSAAAVAAGVAPIGIGTDTGGSVRVPAALCGLVGLKVTHGRIPLSGVFPLASSLDTVGPITATVQDAAVAYAAMAGHDATDPWSRDQPVEVPTEERIGALRFGIPHPWVDRPIAPEQASGLARMRTALEASGATVVDLELPGIDQSDLDRFPAAYHEVADVHRTWIEEDASRYGADIRDRFGPVLALSLDEIEAAGRWRRDLVAAFEDAFTRCDLLLTPATAARAKPIGTDFLDVGAGDEPYRPVLSWFTPLVNQAGLPAIVLPVEDRDVDGLPPSVQLVGPAWTESRLLGVALDLDSTGLVAHRSAPHVTR